MTKGDWIGLANRLTEAGYNVFRFDWRGHGKSSDIKDTAKFWQNAFTGLWNQRYISGSNKKPIKDTFYYKDLGANAMNYMPVYLLDLAAVRSHLDNKNDAGDVNTSSIYIVASENAAALGLAWMATEWNRPQFAPGPNALNFAPKYEYVPQPLRGDYETAGNDISGVVSLSGSRPPSMSKELIKGFISGILPNGSRMPLAPKIRDNTPILFMYAVGDKKSEEAAKTFHLEALAAKGMGNLRPLNDKYLMPIEKGGTLTGVALLGDNEKLKTEDNLMKFLGTLQQDRKSIVRRNRGFIAPYFIRLNEFGMVPQGAQ